MEEQSTEKVTAVPTASPRDVADELMPAYEQHFTESVRVDAPRAAVWSALLQVKGSEMPVARLLSMLRALGKKPEQQIEEKPLAETLEKTGWVKLHEEPERELILGLVGRFWRMDFGIRPVADRAGFVAFTDRGFAKIVFRYQLEGEGAETKLSAETRVHANDRRAARRMRLYWALIGLGARLTVRSGLMAIKRRAESERRREEVRTGPPHGAIV